MARLLGVGVERVLGGEIAVFVLTGADSFWW